ncbi:MAG: PEP-CTERM sorting domain-containing protein [Deltaproteobacteria bacterium]|nr:PEP-CTERM sorting domain-containing protein [Deltaproteobacteria bacterium]
MLLVLACGSASAANVALNSDVTLSGTFFTNGWGGGWVVDKSTVVDGRFLPKNNRWDQGAVWWDARGGNTGQYITIDLGGSYSIYSFIAQVDDNDAYKLEYWDDGSGSWKTAWNIPNYNWYNGVNVWGMQTRPNPFNDNEQYLLPASIVTSKLKLSGDMNNSDRLFSVSEIQAFGEPVPAPVPEPGTMLLLGSGLVGLAGYGRKRTVRK